MSRINLSNVNISIQQFQEISSGKYNAGEVRLKNNHALSKINNHVGSYGDNDVSLSHAEVIAIKDAFVRALKANGVGKPAIDRIREELGLASKGEGDTSLARRSIKPLSRQQIREILDRHQQTINNSTGERTIVSYDELHARYTLAERAEIVRTRNATNADMVRRRATLPDRAILDLQAVLAGDVQFRTAEECARLITSAERIKAAILQRSQNGVVSTQPGAKIKVHRGSDGLDVTFSLGGSDADALRRIEDLLIMLRHMRQPNHEVFAVRREFAGLATKEARIDWVQTLPTDPRGSFKARTVAVGLLYERGIRDFDTLSLVNKITDEAAMSLVATLVGDPGGLRGDALRQSAIVANLAQKVVPRSVSEGDVTFVPALSQAEYIDSVYDGASGKRPELQTQEMRAICPAVLAELRARFGADAVPANAEFSSYVSITQMTNALGDTTYGVHNKTSAEIKVALVRDAARGVAQRVLIAALKPMVVAAGLKDYVATGIASTLMALQKALGDRLAAAKSPAEVNAIIEEFRPHMQEGIRKAVLLNKYRAAAPEWYKAALAQALKIPVSSLAGGAGNVIRLNVMTNNLAHDIAIGKNPASTEAEVEQAFRTLVEGHVAERVDMLRDLDGLKGLPGEARDIMKNFVFQVTAKMPKVKVDDLMKASQKVSTDEVVAAMNGGNKDTILQALGRFVYRATEEAGRAMNSAKAQTDDLDMPKKMVITMALSRTPGLLGRVSEFFMRPDMANFSVRTDIGDARYVTAMIFFRPDEPIADSNAALADTLGRPGLAPLAAQAVVFGLDDLGFGGLSVEQKMSLVKGAELRALAQEVRASTAAVTPSKLREMVHRHFAAKAVDRVANEYFANLAKKNDIDPEGIAGYCRNVVFMRDETLAGKIVEAIKAAAAAGDDPKAAVADLLAPFDEVALAALRSFEQIKIVDVSGRSIAEGEIALRANLPLEDVQKHLSMNGFPLAGGSLAVLRDAVREELGNPATDVKNWDPASVRDRAMAKLQSFIDKKVNFLNAVSDLKNVNGNALSQATLGKLLVATLSNRDYDNAETAGAAVRILQRQEMRQAFEFAKASLVPDTIANMTSKDIFRVFEAIAALVKDAIVADLGEEKYGLMDAENKDVLQAIINAALIDYCDGTLLATAERLAADGQLDKVYAAGQEVQEAYIQAYMDAGSGLTAVNGQAIEKDAAAANRAAQNRVVASIAVVMVGTVRQALEDEWLPEDLAEKIHSVGAGQENLDRAAAVLKRAPALLERYATGLNAEQRAELKGLLITLDLRNNALAESEARLRTKVSEIKLQGGGSFTEPGSVSAQMAIEMGYAKDELQILESVATIYRQATGCTEAEARAIALDSSSAPRRLYAYGGRFTASVENFRAGLALVGTFNNWFASTVNAVQTRGGRNAQAQAKKSLTVMNADGPYFNADARYAYEKFIFEHIAIDDSLPLAADDPEKIFGMGNNPVTRFVGRAYVTAATYTLAQIPPEKRITLFAVFDALLPLPQKEADFALNSHGGFNGYLIGRVLAHLDEIEEMRKAGTLTKESFCNRFLTDIPGAAQMTVKQMGDWMGDKITEIGVARFNGNYDTISKISFMIQSSGRTIEECTTAVAEDRTLPAAPYISSANGGIAELGTTSGSRGQLVLDLKRPANAVYITANTQVLNRADNVFTVVFPDGTSIKSASADDADRIADKIEELCGKVHPQQLNAVYMALTQAGEGPVMGAFIQSNDIRTTEHTPLTYTFSRDAQTGVVTIRYSEPSGFPVKFHWDATITLDGTVVTTQMVVEQ